MSPQELRELPRTRLAQLARSAGIVEWKTLTRLELVDELQRNRENGVLAVDVASPHWLTVRWRLTPEMEHRPLPNGSARRRGTTLFLIVYECGDPEVSVASRRRLKTLALPADATLWQVQVENPGCYYQLELGMGTSPDEMTVIAHSALIRTANGSGSPNGGNHHDASPQPAIETGPAPLAVQCELCIHGRTSAGTRITIDDEPVAVDAGGEFEARFPLVDGRSMFPVVGTNASGTERRTVAIVVEHHARHIEPERSRLADRKTR